MSKNTDLNTTMSQAKQGFYLGVALFSTLISVLLHIYLTRHFYEVRYSGTSGASFCNVNAYFNCDAVAASSFAALFNIPISLFGLIINIILFSLLVPLKWFHPSDRDFLVRMSKLFAFIIFSASMVMGTITAFFMEQACLVCLGTYFFSILTFFSLWFLESGTIKKDVLLSDVTALFQSKKFYLALFSAPIWGAFFINFLIAETMGFNKIEPLIKESLYYWKTNPAYTFQPESGLTFQKSNTPALLTIIEFADFGCPHCKSAAPALHTFALQHPDVKLIFKPFPLDGNCNAALDGHRGNGVRCFLAQSVFCLEKSKGKGWLTHDSIFEDQEIYMKMSSVQEALEYLSAKIEVPKEDLKNCTESPEIQKIVVDSAQEGSTAKIEGTPTVFVNGRKLDRGYFLPLLEKVYQEVKATSSK